MHCYWEQQYAWKLDFDFENLLLRNHLLLQLSPVVATSVWCFRKASGSKIINIHILRTISTKQASPFSAGIVFSSGRPEVVEETHSPFEMTSTLVIRNASDRDASKYSCVAKNSLHEAATMIRVYSESSVPFFVTCIFCVSQTFPLLLFNSLRLEWSVTSIFLGRAVAVAQFQSL